MKEFPFAVCTLFGFFTHLNKVLSRPILVCVSCCSCWEQGAKTEAERSAKGWQRQQAGKRAIWQLSTSQRSIIQQLKEKPWKRYFWSLDRLETERKDMMPLSRRHFIKYNLWVTEGNPGPLFPFQELSRIYRLT